MRRRGAYLPRPTAVPALPGSDAVVFLDKDGTLIENLPYNVAPTRIRLAAGAVGALRRLAAAGFRLAVVSNQPGVAFGRFPERALRDVRARIEALLALAGVSLAGFYYCPHHPGGTVRGYAVPCSCRKPAPGLVLRAAHELGAELRRSWLIGDILDDMEAGNRAGCRTVLLDVGNETEWVRAPQREPDRVVRDLAAAADYILTSGRDGADALARGIAARSAP
ncbi:MAG TPA: HAD-IIIA family hydrolase [Gemmatimonadaceae bacterium]|nr:HAD-IIIA family hydrolase [Gemmatimonadaceae bacterium]